MKRKQAKFQFESFQEAKRNQNLLRIITEKRDFVSTTQKTQ
jgi:hypothetical protein